MITNLTIPASICPSQTKILPTAPAEAASAVTAKLHYVPIVRLQHSERRAAVLELRTFYVLRSIYRQNQALVKATKALFDQRHTLT